MSELWYSLGLTQNSVILSDDTYASIVNTLRSHSGQSVFLWAIYVLFLSFVVTSSYFRLIFFFDGGTTSMQLSSVVDPGFPRWMAPSPEFRTKIYYLIRFLLNTA